MSESLAGLEAILFDFGGTLDGPGEPWVDRFAAAYRREGLDLATEQVRAAVGYGTREAYRAPQMAEFDLRATVAFHVERQFAHLSIRDPAKVGAVVDWFVARTNEALAESRGVLERLQWRFRLGLVSNFYGNVARIVADAGIAPLLTAIIDSTVVGVSKPDPRIFALAIEQLDTTAPATLYVGDSLEQDILPARSAGLRTAWLSRAGTAPAAVVDLQVATLADLERFL